MPESPRILVAIATYNERQTLPGLVDEIRAHLPEVEILVVDDNSPDGTGEWCSERAARDPQFHVVHRSGKLGLGSATVAGLRYAVDNDYDLVMTLDADFSHPPRYLPAMVAALSDRDQPADVVIGSRYVAGGGIEGWPLVRRWMSLCVNWYTRTLLRLPVRDCSGAFRGFRTSILRDFPWQAIRSTGYSFMEEVLFLLYQRGARIREVPITYVGRKTGRSKISLREAGVALWVILRLAMGKPTRQG